MSGITVILCKSFVHPSPPGFLTTFRTPCLFSVKFKSKQIHGASSDTSRFPNSLNYEQLGRNNFAPKTLLRPGMEEARFEQLVRSKDFPIRSFLSKSAVSQGFELAPVYRRKIKRCRNATVGGHSDRNSRSSFSVDEGFSSVSPDEQKQAPPKFSVDDSGAVRSELLRVEQFVTSNRYRTIRGSSGTGEEGRSEQSTTFEQWAVNKLREEGLSSLTVIEDMRQTFVPGSPPLDPRLLFSEAEAAELRELESRSISNRSFQPKSIRSNRRDEKSSSTSANQIMPMDSKSSLRRFSDQTTNVKQAEERKYNAAGPPHPTPLLVKRKTTVPENWNGPGGTVVLIDKPQGWTSFAVCGKLRHTLKIQKVGHAGTLDPMATGLLIVCLGKATKLADSYQAMTKVYSGMFRLGEDTPSLDADTEVSVTLPWEYITDGDIDKAKQAFIGEILQSPPMYSAIKIKGERLYAKARRGEEIEVPARPVTVHEFEVSRSSDNRQEFHFRVTCSKGTYVRSLCSDLGRALGSYAHLTVLRREKIGNYSVSDAWTIEDLLENYNQQYRNFTSRSSA